MTQLEKNYSPHAWRGPPLVRTVKQQALVSARGIVGFGVLWPPVACACGRMVSFVVNRNGKTRCVECDEKETAK